MDMMTFISQNEDETIQFGKKIADLLTEGMVILLEGDLGVGKTTLTKGLALGLGIKKNITSPTFTIMKVYHGKHTLYHIDAYRLEGVDQDLGFEDYIYDDGITVIEWPEYFDMSLIREYLKINISYMDEGKRKLVLQAAGKDYQNILEELSC